MAGNSSNDDVYCCGNATVNLVFGFSGAMASCEGSRGFLVSQKLYEASAISTEMDRICAEPCKGSGVCRSGWLGTSFASYIN